MDNGPSTSSAQSLLLATDKLVGTHEWMDGWLFRLLLLFPFATLITQYWAIEWAVLALCTGHNVFILKNRVSVGWLVGWLSVFMIVP